jgi:hypothetical protein
VNDPAAPTLLIAPGLRDRVPAHWPTLLEQKLPKAKSVPPDCESPRPAGDPTPEVVRENGWLPTPRVEACIRELG